MNNQGERQKGAGASLQSDKRGMLAADWRILPNRAQQAVNQGSFVNTKTGEIRAYFVNPPQGGEWRLLSPRLDTTLEDAVRIVKQGGYGNLDPKKLHF